MHLNSNLKLKENYEIKKKISSNKNISINLAVRKDGLKVIIKASDKEDISNKEKQILRNEVLSTMFIRHPYIIRCLDAWETHETTYIVLEYLQGKFLNDLIVQATFTEEEARKHISTIIDAISYLHSCSIVHRDIRPENILVVEGQSKIIDFRNSQLILNDALIEMCGSLQFMAPEIVEKKGYGKEVDIWSCGIILYYMVTGVVPFSSSMGELTFECIMGQSEIFTSTQKSTASIELQNLLRKMLEKNPSLRITIPEMLENIWFKS